MSNTKRPIKDDADSSVYSCPTGYKPCVEAFLESVETLEYVYCIPESADASSMCPITAIAFTLEGMSTGEKSKYYRAKQQKANHSKLTDFYISKTVAAHPIEEVRVKAALPCWSRQEISQAANHQFYFSEVASFQDQCTNSNENFK